MHTCLFLAALQTVIWLIDYFSLFISSFWKHFDKGLDSQSCIWTNHNTCNTATMSFGHLRPTSRYLAIMHKKPPKHSRSAQNLIPSTVMERWWYGLATGQGSQSQRKICNGREKKRVQVLLKVQSNCDRTLREFCINYLPQTSLS